MWDTLRREDAEIVIAGGGPAGAACAALLARQGRRVMVLEEKRFPRDKVCGECLSGAALDALARLDLADQVTRRSVELTKLRISARGGHWETPLQRDRTLSPRAISRRVLDELLRQLALESGVEFRTGWRVRGAVIQDGVVRGLEAAPSHAATAATFIHAPLTIAADGRHSLVARQTGRIAQRRGVALLGFKRHLRADEGEPPGTLEMYSLPGGYVGVCPLPGGWLNVCGVAPYGAVRAAQLGLDECLERWTGSQPRLAALLARGADDAKWLTMPAVQRQRIEEKTPGVVYLGDARQTVAPLAGQGMTLALTSAVALAHLIGRHASMDPRVLQKRWASQERGQHARLLERADRYESLLVRPGLLSAIRFVSQVAPGLSRAAVRRAYCSTVPT